MSTMDVETKDAYATRVMEEHRELIEGWTSEQLSLLQSLVFNDDDLSFSVKVQRPGSQEVAAIVSNDFDVPEVHQVDLIDLALDGLKYIGGLDISFVSGTADGPEDADNSHTTQENLDVGDDEPDAYATLVVVEYPSLELRHSITHPTHMDVPYIPTFLSYREAPAYLKLIDALRTKLVEDGQENQFPQVFLVDGNGRLHIRETGVASVVGVQANVPTIGVAKNFLPHHPDMLPPELKARASGHWRSSQQGMRAMIRHVLPNHGSWFGLFNATGDAYAGAALIPASSKTPLFVSPGHRVSLDTAIRVTLAVGQYKIPEPVRLADKISRVAAAGRAAGS